MPAMDPPLFAHPTRQEESRTREELPMSPEKFPRAKRKATPTGSDDFSTSSLIPLWQEIPIFLRPTDLLLTPPVNNP